MVSIFAVLLFHASAFASTPTAALFDRFFGLELSPPPALDSEWGRNDFVVLHRYQNERTDEDCAQAAKQTKFTLRNTFGPETGILTDAEFRRIKTLGYKVIAKSSMAVYYFKRKFHRPRPFLEDPTLKPCVALPRDLSYPSGHATTGYALALAIAKVFPEKHDEILRQGFQIGENRIISGVHHPSDVEAGRELARQLVRENHFE